MNRHDERPARPARTRAAMGRRLVWPLLGIGLLLAIVLPVAAMAESPSTAQKLNSIRERMDTGQALFQSGRLEAAAHVFDDSFSKYPYSAFLFNAGVCYERLGQLDDALTRFQRYLEVDPSAPDVGMVRERISDIRARLSARASAAPDGGTAGAAGDAAAGADAGLWDAETPAAEEGLDAGAPNVAVEAGDGRTPRSSASGADAMKSLVLIETEPPGAPLELWAPTNASATPYVVGGTNPEWRVVARVSAPASLTLDVGRYHVVVPRHRDYNRTERDIQVSSGKVLHFMANLSQGEFMGFLRVGANVPGAAVYLDDPARRRPPWGTAPHAELISPGEYDVLVSARGYEPYRERIRIDQGEQRELTATLERVGFGVLRVSGTAPEIHVRIDGRPVGSWRSGEPALEIELSAGPHELTVTSRRRKPYHGTVEVPKGRILPVQVRMIKTYPRGPAWTQAVFGGVLVGASTYFGLESNRLHRELRDDKRSGVLTDGDPRLLRGKLYAVGADAGFAVAGVLALLATHNFVKDPLPESSKKEGEPLEFGAPNRTPEQGPGEPQPRQSRNRLGVVPAERAAGGSLWLGGTF